MALPGTEAIRTLQRGARKARRSADLLTGELSGLQARILEAVERRGAAVAALAKHYLPAFDAQNLGQVFDDVRRELEVIQLRQRVRIDELAKAIAAANAERTAHEQELEGVTHELESKVAERTRLETELATSLAADTGFQALTNEVAHATARLERDEDRVAELRAEAKRKLPAYERSVFFRYLTRRGYGGSAYRPGTLARRMDRFVSELIDWPRAKAGYDFLRSTPELVQAEVERRREEFQERMKELEERQQRAATKLGLPTVMAEGTALGERRDALLHRIEDAHGKASRAAEDYASVSSSTGQFHADALQKLRSWLEGLGTAALAARANATADPEDDRLVVAIDSADREVTAMRDRSATLSTERETAANRADRMQALVDDLRRRECDSVRCGFETMTPNAFERRVDAIAEGADDLDALRKDLESSLRFSAPASSILDGPSPFATGNGPGIPWWALHAIGAVADIALRGAVSRGIGRHFGSGGSSRSSSGSAPRSLGGGGGGGTSSGGGRFTRGSGF